MIPLFLIILTATVVAGTELMRGSLSLLVA